MSDLVNIEENILFSFYGCDVDVDLGESFLNDLNNGKFLSVLNSVYCEEVFAETLKKSSLDEPLNTLLSQCVESFLDQHSSNRLKQLQILCIGVASLSYFMQANWTGPPIAEDGIVPGWFPVVRCEEAVSCLEVDGESCCSTIRQPSLLVLARAVFRSCSDWLSDWPTCRWWWARTLFVHQQVLEEHSATLHAALMSLLTNETLPSLCVGLGSHTCTVINLEAARFHLYYGEVKNSAEKFKIALESAGMKVELVGALGRRTHFQERDLAQLTLKVVMENNAEQSYCHETENMPKDLQLNDEVRLNRIKFVSEADGTVPHMMPIQQAIILGMFVQTQKSQPADELMDEELTPYLQCVLNQPQWWSLQTAALLFRSRLESKHRRTVERALMQVQSLVDNVNHEEPQVQDRLWGLFCSYLPPVWQLEADLAHLLVSLGSVNSALDIFLRLQMWEEVISCYTLLKLRHKAAEIICQELQKKETVKLWCLLGDATDEPAHYERAWDLSEHRSALAQRHWGLFYFVRKQYSESILHFQQSLSCNSLQTLVWFRLGYAALVTENWELSASAYRHYCNLDTDNFEAWNNLAKAYVKLGQKARAWKALQEAVKCNFENWQVWDNLLVVSTDCAEFEEVIRSYHRILDLKQKHIDMEVLSIVTEAVRKNLPDNQGAPAGRLFPKVLALFGRLTGQVTDNARLWLLYAQLNASRPEQTLETQHKTIQYFQRAHRAAVQSLHWEKEVASCQEVLEQSCKLSDAALEISDVKILNAVRLSLKGVVSTVTASYPEFSSENDPLKETLHSLVGKLELIMAKIQQLQEE